MMLYTDTNTIRTVPIKNFQDPVQVINIKTTDQVTRLDFYVDDLLIIQSLKAFNKMNKVRTSLFRKQDSGVFGKTAFDAKLSDGRDRV